MRLVPLTNSDRFAIVDDDDYQAVAAHKWALAEPCKGHFYARKTTADEPRFLHRFIAVRAGLSGETIDHRNRAGLDNRRANLRGCTYAVNSQNGSWKRGASGVRGVCKSGDGWVVKFRRNGKLLYFGYFTHAAEAKVIADGAFAELLKEAERGAA